MAGPFVQRVYPTLRILDADAARRFYVERLGFRVDWEWRQGGPAFLQVSRGGLALYLSESPRDGEPGGLAYLYVPDVDAWQAELAEAGVELEEEPRDQPWGNRELRLRDPFGNRLCIATSRLRPG
jgi:catechol 2,3-dioxygenase-like lactoylglutathione lyase family enzyme